MLLLPGYISVCSCNRGVSCLMPLASCLMPFAFSSHKHLKSFRHLRPTALQRLRWTPQTMKQHHPTLLATTDLPCLMIHRQWQGTGRNPYDLASLNINELKCVHAFGSVGIREAFLPSSLSEKVMNHNANVHTITGKVRVGYI